MGGWQTSTIIEEVDLIQFHWIKHIFVEHCQMAGTGDGTGFERFSSFVQLKVQQELQTKGQKQQHPEVVTMKCMHYTLG